MSDTADTTGVAPGGKREAGAYSNGLRLGMMQERTLRRWPLERIRPKSVALGLRSLLAEVDALRAERDEARAALAQAEERTRALVRVVEQAIDWIEMPIQAYSLKWGVDWQYGDDPTPHWTALKRALAAAGPRAAGGGEGGV